MSLSQYLIYVALTVVSLGLSIYMLATLWRIRKSPGAVSLMWVLHCVLIWSLAYIFEISLPTLDLKYLALKAQYFGIPFIAPAIFVFSLYFTGRRGWLRWYRFLLLLVIPLITFGLAWTNQAHEWIWTEVRLSSNAALSPLAFGHGRWYNINVIYSYGLLVLALVLFAEVAIRSHRLYRAQAITMVLGMLVAWSGNVLYVFDLLPGANLDWTPLSFTLGAAILTIGFARYKLVDVLPIAHTSVFNAMTDGVIVTDPRGRIVDVNPAAERIYARHSAEMLGQPIQQLLPSWVDWKTQTKAAFETSHMIHLEKGNQKRIYGLRIAPILGPRDRVDGQMLILTDITEQREADSQMLMQVMALEAVQNGVVITNPQGEIEWVNPAFSALTGYSLPEALGKKPSILKSGQMPPEFYRQLWETISAGQVWRGELINRRKDGTLYHEEMSITPVRQGDKITHYIAIKQDISIRKEAEQAMREARDAAIEANRIKTQLLANVSHDLRSPLGAIIGYAEMLQANIFGPVTTDQAKATREILDSANQLLTFVNNLIGQAQLETGRVIIRERPFEPLTLVESVRPTASYQAARKDLQLTFEIDPALPATLLGDDYWLQQIVHNLVNNALKFTEQGSVAVRFFAMDERHWAIEVKDTGIGIPQEYHEKIFSAFEQVDGTATRRIGGSGLGLSIVKQLTDLMGGSVRLESAPGQGATFTVILPLKTPDEKKP
ncbi:MAG: histidine kinase N-terminal 7TM domain-containing protein [Anaerolineales bacterium]